MSDTYRYIVRVDPEGPPFVPYAREIVLDGPRPLEAIRETLDRVGVHDSMATRNSGRIEWERVR